MRQVPQSDTIPFGIVGDGRVARHFSHYFTLLGRPVRQWSRRTSTETPVAALAPCRTVLLLIKDSAIEPFVDGWPGLKDHCLVHCSGSLVTPVAQCVHPLMTFGPGVYDLGTYRQIPFVLDAGANALDQLLPGLPNPWFALAPEDRPYYHALCVVAGNFTTLLWREFFARLETRLGIPAAAAHPFLAQTAKNLTADAADALTGPLARRDTDTIAANLRALDGDPLHDIYAAFARAYADRT
jgi:predicted short-subunit dehydrogenase-like oxidoreductase (DUF2520 family)